MQTVTWKITKNVPTGCPDYKPDDYTGELPGFHCGVYHSKWVTEEMVKSFPTLEEAEKFARNAPESCTEIKINGQEIKK